MCQKPYFAKFQVMTSETIFPNVSCVHLLEIWYLTYVSKINKESRRVCGRTVSKVAIHLN